MLQPLGVGGKARIIGQLRMIKHHTQFFPEIFLPCCDNEIAVFGGECLPRHGEFMRGTLWRGHFTGSQVVRGHVAQQIQHAVKHRRFHATALACALTLIQRCQHRLTRKNAAAHVRQRYAHACGRSAWLACYRQITADRLNHQIECREILVSAVTAKTRHRALNDARVDRSQYRVINFQALQHAGAKIIDHHIG